MTRGEKCDYITLIFDNLLYIFQSLIFSKRFMINKLIVINFNITLIYFLSKLSMSKLWDTK